MDDYRLKTIWRNMRKRCCNPKDPAYKNYGGRGIGICAEWNDYAAFKKWAFENGYSDNLTIDRINNDLGYSPNNCRWCSYQVQANNTSTNRKITFEGKTMTCAEWERELGFNAGTVSNRLCISGWSVERALTEPIGYRSQTKRYQYNGERHTVSEWAEIYGISKHTLKGRMRKNGYDIEAALTQVKIGEGNLLTYAGKTQSLSQWAHDLNMGYETLQHRIKYLGWSVEDALSTPVQTRNYAKTTAF